MYYPTHIFSCFEDGGRVKYEFRRLIAVIESEEWLSAKLASVRESVL